MGIILQLEPLSAVRLGAFIASTKMYLSKETSLSQKDGWMLKQVLRWTDSSSHSVLAAEAALADSKSHSPCLLQYWTLIDLVQSCNGRNEMSPTRSLFSLQDSDYPGYEWEDDAFRPDYFEPATGSDLQTHFWACRVEAKLYNFNRVQEMMKVQGHISDCSTDWGFLDTTLMQTKAGIVSI